MTSVESIPLWIYLFLETCLFCSLPSNFSSATFTFTMISLGVGSKTETSPHSPDAHKNCSQARLKLGAVNSIRVSHMHSKGPSTAVITPYLPRCPLPRSWQLEQSQNSNSVTGYRVPSSVLTSGPKAKASSGTTKIFYSNFKIKSPRTHPKIWRNTQPELFLWRHTHTHPTQYRPQWILFSIAIYFEQVVFTFTLCWPPKPNSYPCVR